MFRRDKALKCYPMPLLCYWAGAFRNDTLAFSRQRDLVFASRKVPECRHMGDTVIATIRQLWIEDHGQDVAEYAVMLAVILVIVIGTVRLIGGNANNVFNQVQSQMSAQ
jgi:Flp pilus assembly pilin Flp